MDQFLVGVLPGADTIHTTSQAVHVVLCKAWESYKWLRLDDAMRAQYALFFRTSCLNDEKDKEQFDAKMKEMGSNATAASVEKHRAPSVWFAKDKEEQGVTIKDYNKILEDATQRYDECAKQTTPNSLACL